jgi:hypothetical protein
MDYGAYNHGVIGYLCNANFGGWFIFCKQKTLDLNLIGFFKWNNFFLKICRGRK